MQFSREALRQDPCAGMISKWSEVLNFSANVLQQDTTHEGGPPLSRYPDPGRMRWKLAAPPLLQAPVPIGRVG